MKRLLTFLVFISLSYLGRAQLLPNVQTWGLNWPRGGFDSVLYTPTGCGIPSGIASLQSYGVVGLGQKLRKAAIFTDTCGHHVYWFDWTDTTWNQLDGGGGGSGTVTSVFVRNDSIFYAASTDTVLVCVALLQLDSTLKYVTPTQMAAALASKLSSISTTNSVAGAGTTGSPVQLVGDQPTPGNSYYYGTNGSGAKGYNPLPSGVAPANPTSSIGLTPVNGSASTYQRSDASPGLAQQPANTIIGNNTGSTAVPAYLTTAQVIAMLNSITNFNGVSFLGYGLYASRPTTGTGMYFASDSIPTGGWFYINGATATNINPSTSITVLRLGQPGDSSLFSITGSALAGYIFHVAAIRDSAGGCIHHVVNADGSWTFYSSCIVNAGNVASFQKGLYSGLPAASGNAGACYIATDSALITCSNGTAWAVVARAAGGGAGGSSPPFADNSALVKNNADNTKLLQFSAVNVTTATTRTLTAQNANYTMAGIDIAQTFGPAQTFTVLPVLPVVNANTIYAGDSSANGQVPGFRKMAVKDLPSTSPWPAQTPLNTIYSKQFWFDMGDVGVNVNTSGFNAYLSAPGGGYINTTATSAAFSSVGYILPGRPTNLTSWTLTVDVEIMSALTANTFFGIGQMGTVTHTSGGMVFYANTSNSGTGALKITNYNGASTLNTGTGTSAVSQFDVLRLTATLKDSVLSCTYQDLTTGSSVTTVTYTYTAGPSNANLAIPNQGNWAFWNFGGTYQIQNITITSPVTRNANLLCIGDSKFQYFYTSSFGTSTPYLLRSQFPTCVNWASSGSMTTDVLAGMNELSALNPQQALVEPGSNDLRFGRSLTQLEASFTQIMNKLLAAGIRPLCFVIPEDSVIAAGGSQANHLTDFKNWMAATYPSYYLDVYTRMSSGNRLLSGLGHGDGIHLNDYGDYVLDSLIVAANYLTQLDPSRRAPYTANDGLLQYHGDSLGLPFTFSGQANHLLVVNNNGQNAGASLIQDNGQQIYMTNPGISGSSSGNTFQGMTNTLFTVNGGIGINGPASAISYGDRGAANQLISYWGTLYSNHQYVWNNTVSGHTKFVMDSSGRAALADFTGAYTFKSQFDLPASTSAYATANIPEGTAPGTLSAGQFYANSSTHNLYWVNNAGTALCATCGGGTNYQTVQLNGSGLTQRANLNILSPLTATDNSGNNSTDLGIAVTTASGASDSVVTSNPSTGLPHRTNLYGVMRNATVVGPSTNGGSLAVANCSSVGTAHFLGGIFGSGTITGGYVTLTVTTANTLTQAEVYPGNSTISAITDVIGSLTAWNNTAAGNVAGYCSGVVSDSGVLLSFYPTATGSYTIYFNFSQIIH